MRRSSSITLAVCIIAIALGGVFGTTLASRNVAPTHSEPPIPDYSEALPLPQGNHVGMQPLAVPAEQLSTQSEFVLLDTETGEAFVARLAENALLAVDGKNVSLSGFEDAMLNEAPASVDAVCEREGLLSRIEIHMP